MTARAMTRNVLAWHEGTHGRMEHDEYRRHGHSANGALTIDPHDPTPHLEGGRPFQDEPELEPDTVLDSSDLDTKLSHLPPKLRYSPEFRQGYQLGISDRVFAEHLAQRDRAPRPADPAPSSTSTFDVMAGDLRSRLGIGDVVVREVFSLKPDVFVTETPCCGRRVTAPHTEESTVVCCRCELAANVTLTEEEPDGYTDEQSYVATFTVSGTGIVVAQHRSGRYER